MSKETREMMSWRTEGGSWNERKLFLEEGGEGNAKVGYKVWTW